MIWTWTCVTKFSHKSQYTYIYVYIYIRTPAAHVAISMFLIDSEPTPRSFLRGGSAASFALGQRLSSRIRKACSAAKIWGWGLFPCFSCSCMWLGLQIQRIWTLQGSSAWFRREENEKNHQKQLHVKFPVPEIDGKISKMPSSFKAPMQPRWQGAHAWFALRAPGALKVMIFVKDAPWQKTPGF